MLVYLFLVLAGAGLTGVLQELTVMALARKGWTVTVRGSGTPALSYAGFEEMLRRLGLSKSAAIATMILLVAIGSMIPGLGPLAGIVSLIRVADALDEDEVLAALGFDSNAAELCGLEVRRLNKPS